MNPEEFKAWFQQKLTDFIEEYDEAAEQDSSTWMDDFITYIEETP